MLHNSNTFMCLFDLKNVIQVYYFIFILYIRELKLNKSMCGFT